MSSQYFKAAGCTCITFKGKEALIRIGFSAWHKGGQDFFLDDFKQHFTTMLLKPPEKGRKLLAPAWNLEKGSKAHCLQGLADFLRAISCFDQFLLRKLC